MVSSLTRVDLTSTLILDTVYFTILFLPAFSNKYGEGIDKVTRSKSFNFYYRGCRPIVPSI